MSIIDSIQLSGSSYDVRDKSATTVVSLTQAQYNALPSSAKTANILYNITDAQGGDLSNYWTTAETQSAITEAVSGKVDTEDLDISGKTLEKVYTFSDGNDFSGFSLSSITIHYNSNILMGGMRVLLRAKNASDNWAIPILTLNTNESGITEYYVSEAGDVSDKFAFSIVNRDLIATITDNDFKIVSFAYANPTAQSNSLYSFIVPSEIESGSTPSVIEEGVYDTLESLSNSVNALKKSNTTYEATTAYYNSVTYPSLSYTTSGITLNYSHLTGDTIHTSLSTDASIDDDKGVLGVYASGATHSVTLNLERKTDRINFIPKSNLVFKASLNQSYTGTLPTTNAIQIRYKDFDGDYSYKQGYWDYNSGTDSFSWTTNPSYVNNTGVSMSYDSVSKVLTFTIDPSIVDTYGNFRFTCPMSIAPASALTQADCFIGFVTIDTNSYKLQEALDNKQDTLSAGTNITISGNVISANGVQVSSAITENDTNPVQGGVLYDELRVSGQSSDVTVEFDSEWHSTNFPSNCATVKVEVTGSMNSATIQFNSGPYKANVGMVGIYNYGSLDVDNTNFADSSYEISGNTVIITYPLSKQIDDLYVYDSPYTIKATPGVSYTPLKDVVAENTTALGGLKLQQISQSDYDALVSGGTVDASTLYVII